MATDKFCDLHTHSVFSDGTWRPEDILREAERIGLCAVALTDHNTLAGIPDFLRAASGGSVEAVAGVEISTDYGSTELHVVGLFLPEDSFERVDSLLAKLRDRKDAANREMIARLVRDGYDLDFDEIKAESEGLFNRAHIASRLMKGGYVGSIAEAFKTLLAKEGKYYVATKRLPVLEVIGFLREIGAVPVLAHPFLNLTEDELREFLPIAKKHGLTAMETIYSTYDENTVRLSRMIAKEFGLSESGGSDFHGERKPDILLGRGYGELAVPYDFYKILKENVVFDN